MNRQVVLQGARLTRWPTQGQTKPSDRILFVDDCSDIREAVPKVLVDSGYRVDVAEDGEAGWEALHATRYDLLITDHKMPKLTGIELVRKLRFARIELPVILASAALPAEAMGRNPLLQIAAVLLKPFTVEELLEMVKAVLGETPEGSTARLPSHPRHSQYPAGVWIRGISLGEHPRAAAGSGPGSGDLGALLQVLPACFGDALDVGIAKQYGAGAVLAWIGFVNHHFADDIGPFRALAGKRGIGLVRFA